MVSENPGMGVRIQSERVSENRRNRQLQSWKCRNDFTHPISDVLHIHECSYPNGVGERDLVNIEHAD